MAGFEIKKAAVELTLNEGVVNDYIKMNGDETHLCPTTRKIKNPNAELFFSPEAFCEIKSHIKWGQKTRINMYEQGGIMVGEVYRDAERGMVCGVVRHIIPSSDNGNETYLMLTHETWTQMYRSFDERFCQKEDDTPDLRIIGWYHTHPNMPVKMSEIDKSTHLQFFPADWQFSVIFNPQRKTWAVYNGKECLSCNGVLVINKQDLLSDEDNEAFEADNPEQAAASLAETTANIPPKRDSGFSIKKHPKPKLTNIPVGQKDATTIPHGDNIQHGKWEQLWGGNLFHFPINADKGDTSFIIDESVILEIREGLLDWDSIGNTMVTTIYYCNCRSTAVFRADTSYHPINKKIGASSHFIGEKENGEIREFGGKTNMANKLSKGDVSIAMVFTERILSEEQLMQRFFIYDCILVFNPTQKNTFSFYSFDRHKRERQGGNTDSFKPITSEKPYFRDSETQETPSPSHRQTGRSQSDAEKAYLQSTGSNYRQSVECGHTFEKRI